MTTASWRKRGISKEDYELFKEAVKARVCCPGPVRCLTDEEKEQLETFLSPEWTLPCPPLSRSSKAKLEAYLQRNPISIMIRPYRPGVHEKKEIFTLRPLPCPRMPKEEAEKLENYLKNNPVTIMIRPYRPGRKETK